MNLRKLSVLAVTTLAVLGSAAAEARPYGRHYGGGRALLRVAPFIAAGAYLASRPYYRPYYYAPTYYYPPAPTYYYPPNPPVYIERAPEYVPPPEPQYSVPPQSQYSEPQEPRYSEPQQPQYSPQPREQAQPEAQNWYFCAESQAYYPNVQSCAGGWQRQAPQQR